MDAENPWYIEQFKQKVCIPGCATSTKVNRQQSRHPASVDSQELEVPSIWVFTWRKGSDPTREGLFSIRALAHDPHFHLRIITLPRASPQQLPDFEYLYSLFHIPSDFVSEILQATTHSFGADGLGSESYTVWARLLGIIPSALPKEAPHWLTSSLVLKQYASSGSTQGQILLILFAPPDGESIWRLINNLFNSSKWAKVLQDPFILLNMVFEAWYLCVDKHAWTVLDRVTATETDLFNQSKQSGAVTKDKLAVDYTDVHLLAKDAIHLVEGVDATLRSLRCVLDAHDELKALKTEDEYGKIWKSTTEALKYRIEMLQSTRLRLASVDKRLQNIINLAFNLSTSYDSKIMLGDSYAMRTLSFLALIFLPISTISTIFGSQFFGTDVVALPNGSMKATLVVSSQLWILWVVSIPITLLIVTGWLFWLRHSQGRYDTIKEDATRRMERFWKANS